MLLFALTGIVIGAMLGGLTVAAIVPATILVLVVAGAVGVAGGEAFGPRTIEVGVLMVCLQFGYFAGAGFRCLLAHGTELVVKGLGSRRPGAPPA
jgi:hypothetical protein